MLGTILLVLLQLAKGAKYLGCFEDSFDKRLFEGSLFTGDPMDPDICEKKCAFTSYPFFGLQYGSECWCGQGAPDASSELAESKCAMPCSNDAAVNCGDKLMASVYQVMLPIRPLQEDSTRPLLGLVMMVKNEGHTLGNTLKPLKGIIDAYYILDTGSTDNTKEVIRKTLGENGFIVDHPFDDYGTSRNRALDIAQFADNPPIFSLMLSADETMHNPEALREFCEKHRNSEGKSHGAYDIVMSTRSNWYSKRLIRTDKGWRYKGRVHEYLAPPPNQATGVGIRVPDAWIKFHATDTDRRGQTQYTILSILLEEKELKPNDTRTSFYLARTYNIIGNHTEALAEYRRRVSLGGWSEEVYQSLFSIVIQMKLLGRPWHELLAGYLEAFNQSPHRAEPLYEIARHYLAKEEYKLAYIFAKEAFELPFPVKEILWTTKRVYDWEAAYCLAQAAYHVKDFELGMRAITHAIEHSPTSMTIEAQLLLLKKDLGEETSAEYQIKSGANDDKSNAVIERKLLAGEASIVAVFRKHLQSFHSEPQEHGALLHPTSKAAFNSVCLKFFRQCDTNGDGSIDAMEFRILVHEILHLDQDNSLDFAEFR